MQARFVARLWPLAVLSALVLASFAKLVAQPGALLVDGAQPGIDAKLRDDLRSVGNDLTRFVLPRFLWMSDQVGRHGRIPHWDPNGFGGRPNVGNPQAGLFYPPIWLAWRIRSPAAPGWLTVAHLLWAGVGTYWLARLQGLGRCAATVAGGCYQAAPYLLGHVFEGHYPLVWSACWYPWAFGAAWLVRQGDGRGVVALSLVLSACALTGHPQGVAYLGIVLAIWAGSDLVRQLASRRHQAAFRALARWGCVAVLAIGLCAIEWLPDFLAQRWTLQSERFDLRAAGRYHLHAANLWQLFNPRALGGPSNYEGPVNYWETVLSIGTVPLVLALVGVRHAPNRAVARGWAALAVLAIGFACGPGLGLFTILYEIVPGMNRFRVPARSLFLASLSGAILAGWGVEAIRRGNTFGPCARRALAVLLGGLALLELTVFAFELSRTTPAARFLAPDAVTSAITEHRPPEPFRVRARDVFYTDLHADHDRVEKTNRYDSFQIQHAADLYETLYPIFAPPRPFLKPEPEVEQRQRAIQQAVLDRFGVALLISDRSEPDAPWPVLGLLEHAVSPFVLYWNPTALPRAYVVPRAMTTFEGQTQPAVVQIAQLCPLQDVWMEHDPLAHHGGPRQPFTPADYESNAPDRLTVRVTTQAPGLLVIVEAWMPGWSALVNGRPAPVFRGDHAFRVVPLLNPGTHVVELFYRAPGWTEGVCWTLLTAVAWLALLGAFATGLPLKRANPCAA